MASTRPSRRSSERHRQSMILRGVSLIGLSFIAFSVGFYPILRSILRFSFRWKMRHVRPLGPQPLAVRPLMAGLECVGVSSARLLRFVRFTEFFFSRLGFSTRRRWRASGETPSSAPVGSSGPCRDSPLVTELPSFQRPFHSLFFGGRVQFSPGQTRFRASLCLTKRKVLPRLFFTGFSVP